MAVNPIPEGYTTLTPYLIVEDAARLIDFLKNAFDATEKQRSVAPNGQVMHAELKIGNAHVMLGEPHEPYKAMPCAIYLYVPDTDATYQQALAAGGTSTQEPVDMFYGDRNAGVKDFAGNMWWIGTHIEDVSPEEMKRREAEFMKKMSGG